ncbi:MAG TPA: M20/M25/M40 family metallo-hydrolase, partial [Woeseiaceae bacterium]
QKQWDNGNDHFPPTSFQVVELSSSGGAPNVTPAELRARFNFRYCTEWDQPRLQQAVTQMLDAHGLDYELDWHLSGEPFLTEPGRLTDAVSQAVFEVTGQRPQLSTGGGTSDGRFIAPAGVDVVELGPVNATIHKVNEHIRLADLPALRDVYRRTLELLLIETAV